MGAHRPTKTGTGVENTRRKKEKKEEEKRKNVYMIFNAEKI